MKSDNLLLDLSESSDNCPSLVISDFGCCLADKSNGLYLPYNSHDVDKGGNVALMAPEVITATPGSFTSINYTKSDLWTAGTIAYEIFGMKNPFYGNDKGTNNLKNYNYTDEDLPQLPSSVPSTIAAVVKNILSRNFYQVQIILGIWNIFGNKTVYLMMKLLQLQRLSALNAANIVQLYLWAPNLWFQKDRKLPTNNEVNSANIHLLRKIIFLDFFYNTLLHFADNAMAVVSYYKGDVRGTFS